MVDQQLSISLAGTFCESSVMHIIGSRPFSYLLAGSIARVGGTLEEIRFGMDFTASKY